jgi:hypothetical protein
MRLQPVLVTALAAPLALAACDAADDPEGGGPAVCHGKCDDDGPRMGLLYAPQYEHSAHWRQDGRFGLEQATAAADAMAAAGWGTIEVVPVDGIEAMLADLEARAEEKLQYDLIGTVSHATRGGPVFDDTTDTRSTVQAGWSWFGFDEPISKLENGGPVDITGLEELTSRLAAVSAPDGRITFFGCNTGRQTIASVPRSKPVNSAYAEGTPFFIEGEATPRRYKTYVHAIADLTGRLTQGSNTRMSLELTTSILETLYYGGGDGTGGLPTFYTSVLPADAKADMLAGVDAYTFDAAEGVYEATGGCDEASDACASADERWAEEE